MSEQRSLTEIRNWLVEEVARRQNLAVTAVNPLEPFANFMIDSIEALNLAADLEQWAGVVLPETALWDFPTIQSLSEFVVEKSAQR